MLTKILIADSCEEFRLALTGLLKDRYCVRSCPDGAEALALLNSFSPDLVIVDLMLQNVDGLTVMQAARKMPSCPSILATAIYYPAYAANLFHHLNVVYSVLKPCDLDYLVERIDDLVSNVCICSLPAASPYSTVTAALLELGMNAGRSGFQYIRDSILMLADQPSLLVTKDIYPVISARYNTSATAVEKNIRDIIAAVWRDTSPSVLSRYFTPASNGQIPRPTNHVFMSTMTERLFSVEQMAK